MLEILISIMWILPYQCKEEQEKYFTYIHIHSFRWDDNWKYAMKRKHRSKEQWERFTEKRLFRNEKKTYAKLSFIIGFNKVMSVA